MQPANKLNIDGLFNNMTYTDAIDLINRTYDIEQIEEKIEAYNYIISKYKSEKELHIAYYNRGMLYFANGNYHKAITDFSLAIAQENADYHYHFWRAKAYKNIGEYKRALDDCENAIHWFGKGLKSNGFKETEVLNMSLEKIDMLNLKANIHLALKEYNNAEKIISALIKKSETTEAKAISAKSEDMLKKFAEIHNLSGEYLTQTKHYSNAILDYNSAIDMHPENPVYYHNRGNAYMQLGKYDEAIDDFSKAIELLPTDEYYSSRGRAYLEKTDITKAINNFNKAIDLNNNCKDAYIYRSKCYLRQKEYIKAIDDLSTAMSLSTTASSCEDIDNLNLGDINNIISRSILYSCMGDFSNAVIDLSKALEFVKLYEMSSLLNQQKNIISKAIDTLTDNDTNAYDNQLSKLLKSTLKKPEIISLIDDKKTPAEIGILIDETEASKLIKLINEAKEPGKIVSFVLKHPEITEFLTNAKNKFPETIKNLKDIIYSSRAKAYMGLKEYTMAEADIEKIRYKKDNVDINVLKAKLFNLHENYDMTIHEVKTSINKNVSPQNRSPLYQEIGTALFKKGNNELALKNYEEAIKHNRNNKSAYALKGEVYNALRKEHSASRQVDNALKDWDMQIDCYKTFLSMKPDPSEYPDGYSRLDYAFAIKDYIENRLNPSIGNAKDDNNSDEELKALTDKREALSKLISSSDINDNINDNNLELIEEFPNGEILFETQIEETSIDETLIEAPIAPIVEDASAEESPDENSKVNISFNEFVQDIKSEKNNTTVTPSSNEAEAAAKNPEK